jgi:hypothetical protein
MEGPTHSTSFEGGVELGVADEQLQRQPHMQPSSSSLTARKKTINDFAIHSIFGEFVKAAEQKLAVILSQPFELREVDIASYIRFGIDRSFDKIIAALGSIAKHRPRAVIDAVMIWRRSKGDPVSDLEFIKSKM